MGASLKMLSGIFVHVWRAKNTIDFALGWQRNRTNCSGSSVISRLDDLLTREIKHSPVKCFEANTNFLLGNGTRHQVERCSAPKELDFLVALSWRLAKKPASNKIDRLGGYHLVGQCRLTERSWTQRRRRSYGHLRE